ncbi:Prodigiosin synthesizing transferase PigC [Paenibacillus plantiphilus]|uniref:Prodigiosin synthesizing transferase PigC n=1 Tax=Paenibacillus plantiphilus TaxID=2905650 RepID=A0ABN8GFE2_9BACL|nr:PEP/pyruvate-binding domain-containing protein [Paenibacillus plantiphilus]CAH1201892.1 Prodigiosin synthesizing transferase PigC [Paenibacillus plantiphilus]
MSTPKDALRTEPHLLHLSTDEADAITVGGKAARLMELHKLRYPVPHGFVLTVQAFLLYCNFNTIDVHNPHSERSMLADQIKSGAFPQTIKQAVDSALEQYAFESYAVRSSSAAEDGAEHSMAGQFETYLNVSPADVYDRIRACWASIFSAAVAAYNERSDIAHTHTLQMGVIVQEQKHPQYAGVLFTMNPISMDTDYLIIEWVDGLGDKLVSGDVTPDRSIVSRMTGQIPRQTDNPLLEEALARLVQLALKIEHDYQFPVDLEWCIDGQKVIILQVRPITGLMGKQLVLWTNVNMVENFPSVVTPFTWSIVDQFYQHYTRRMLGLFGWSNDQLARIRSIVDHTTGIHAGRIYYNLSNWYEGAYLLPIGPLLKKLLDNFIGQYVPFQFEPRTDPPVKSQHGSFKALRYGAFAYQFIKLWATAGRKVQQYETGFYAHREQWRSSGYEGQSLDQLLQVLDTLMNRFVSRYYDRPAIVDLLAAIFPGGLKLLIKRWIKDESINNDLAAVHVMQTDDLRSLEPTRLIEEQATLIGMQAQWQQLLEDGKYDELEQQINGEALRVFKLFMHQFGGRCYHDCTIVSPTFEERHDLYWQLVNKYQHVSVHRNTSGESSSPAAAIDWLGLINQSLPFWKRMAFRFMLRHTHKAIRLREKSRIIRSLLFGEIRQIVLAIGSRLVDKGHLEQNEHVFYLRWNEIEELSYGKFQFPETIPQLIAMRQEAHRNNEKVDPPGLFMREQGRYYQVKDWKEHSQTQEESRLIGIAVSGGRVVGRARIILDPVQDQRLQPGDILVTRSTDPGWTPLFKIAGGLILEKGGMLSHGAIVAREFGIPAITAVEKATASIADGDLLIVNGDTGEIEWLERVSERAAG